MMAASGATIDFFRYRNPFAAGISGYVVTDAFIDKIHKRIAENGADMIDAWMYKLCGDSTNEQDQRIRRRPSSGATPRWIEDTSIGTERNTRMDREARVPSLLGVVGVLERTVKEVVHADV